MRFSTVIASSALVAPSIAGYVVQDDYSPENFFSMFDFYTGADPTNGEFSVFLDRGQDTHTLPQALSIMSILRLPTPPA